MPVNFNMVNILIIIGYQRTLNFDMVNTLITSYRIPDDINHLEHVSACVAIYNTTET